MITFFATAKPFKGHNGIIQRNALKSWLLLDTDVEIILFGNEHGASEIAEELHIRHEPNVERTQFGTIRIDRMFIRAQSMARHNVLCYSNCDIMFLPDFSKAIRLINNVHPVFLATGRRWNMDITSPIDFSDTQWQDKLKDKTLRAHGRQTRWFIDYFAFSRGFFTADIPPLAVGRIYWDNWMLWKASQSGKPLIDMSPAVVAVHQNHDYLHHPKGRQGVYAGDEALHNLELAGGWHHLRTISDATLVLRGNKLRRNPKRYWHVLKRAANPAARMLVYSIWNPIWFAVLDFTRPLRTALGLRSHAARRSRDKI